MSEVANPVTALAELDRLQQRLAQIQTPRDAKSEADWSKVMLELARALGLSLDEQNRIAEHRLRSQRRGGELLDPDREHRGGSKTRGAFLKEVGLEDTESGRWQAIARLDEDVFERYIAETIEDEEELTTAGLLKLTKQPKAVPGPNSFTLNGGLRRYSPADMETPTIVALILRVLFPDALTALDVTYGSGAFWDGSAHVDVTAHDGDPTRAPDGVADFRDLSRYDDEAFDVVLFDPPHLADAGDSIMRERFGTYDQKELELAMCEGAVEAWRVARLGVVIKVTDHVHGSAAHVDGLFRRQTGWIIETIGQEPYDVVHQVRTSPLVDPKWQQQLSAYNNGSTYLIFRKGDQFHIRRSPE